MANELVSRTATGFSIRREALEAPFARRTEERSHMEDRFDERTGKKRKPVKVVDAPAREYFVLDGVELVDKEGEEDEPEDEQDHRHGFRYDVLTTALSKRFACVVEPYGGEEDEFVYVGLDGEDDDSEEDRVLQDELKKLPELERIAGEFRALGVDLGEVKIVRVWDWC